MYCRFPWERNRWSKAWQPKVTRSLFKIGECHARAGNSGQHAGDNKRFRCCGVTNTTQDTCRYKGAECFKCHKTVHFCNSEDGFRAAIFSLESESQDSEMSAPTVKVPVQIEDIFKWKWIPEQRHLSWVTQNNISKLYLALRPVNKSFHAYIGTPLDIAGKVLVDLENNDQQLTTIAHCSGWNVRPSPPWKGMDDEDLPGLEELFLTV